MPNTVKLEARASQASHAFGVAHLTIGGRAGRRISEGRDADSIFRTFRRVLRPRSAYALFASRANAGDSRANVARTAETLGDHVDACALRDRNIPVPGKPESRSRSDARRRT
ncbi:hypothetical protein [Burkholderia singularis]|uniref:hypothetical protein n=1 Tax=Burkholderia singularis TaxID=1503053 RepID=UPI000F78C2E5|nr:hypothetical protein [Burkholderia singularis]